MNPDYATLSLLLQNHPAWRLLRSDHAPLIASFLHRIFIAPNVRVMAQADLAEALEDELFGLREQLGDRTHSRSRRSITSTTGPPTTRLAAQVLPRRLGRAAFRPDAGHRKSHRLARHADRAQLRRHRIAPADAVRAAAADERRQRDRPAGCALRSCSKRRDEIDAEIARVLAGDVPLLDDTALKDRFQQFTALARELLADFREVEHNFRDLDRRVRERIALWEGSKGALLEEIMGERDAIADSDQGRSFRAFWDFLMSQPPAGGTDALLERVLALPPVAELKPDARTAPRPLRLAGSRRTYAAHGGAAVAAAAALSGRPGLAGEPPHHGHPARHRSQGAGAARCAAGGRVHGHRRDRRRHRAADGAAAVHAADQAG